MYIFFELDMNVIFIFEKKMSLNEFLVLVI